MAIQFSCPEATPTTIPCQFCGPEGDWTLNMPDLLNEHGRCDEWCDGTQHQQEEPWCEVGNAFRMSFFNLVGIPFDECGTIETEAIPAVLRQIMVVLNSEDSTDHMVQAPFEGHGQTRMTMVGGMPTISQGPRVISQGLSDERIRARVESLRDLLVWAKERGFKVCWS